MTANLIILCPGQGAQAVGMGQAWGNASPAAAAIFAAADEIVGARFDRPFSQLCLEGPADLLNRTEVAQPAIFVTSVACHAALFPAAAPPSLAAAGLSLGEYTALHLAGAMSFADALQLVLLRGRAMQDAAEASAGSMVALLGADEEQAHQLCRDAAQGQVLVPANFNSPGQIVISGDADACARAVQLAETRMFRATPLPVAGAFHSPLMAPAAERLAQAVAAVKLQEPACPVLSNVTARPYAGGPAAVAEIRQGLVRQLTEPVRWAQSCQWLAEHASGQYHELAPGKVLAGLMRRIDRNIKVTSHDRPADEPTP